MTLGEQIRTARENKNLSQEALAEYLCVSRQAVSKWENDIATPQGANMTMLIELLGLETRKEETPLRKTNVAAWIGWVLAGIFLLALVSTLLMHNSSTQNASDDNPVEFPSVESQTEEYIKEPSLHSIRFYDNTQQEVTCPWPSNEFPIAYNMALVDSILLQWTGDIPLKTVKMFCEVAGEKAQLVDEFTGPSDDSHTLLLPADALYYMDQTNLYFELHFAENFIITSENIGIYFDADITIDAYIEGFDGQLLIYDKVEWFTFITEDDLARAKELGIEDPGGGFYIYNEREATTQSLLAEDCTYTVLDWNANYTPVTLSVSEFETILNERAGFYAAVPFVLTFRGNEIIAIQEHYVP